MTFCYLTQNFAKQPLGFLFSSARMSARISASVHASCCGLVEVAREADLVADLDVAGLVPDVRCVRQNLAAQEGIDAARLLAAGFARCRAGRGPARTPPPQARR